MSRPERTMGRWLTDVAEFKYYDPTIGRSINADKYATTGQGVVRDNMFAYCNNNISAGGFLVMGFEASFINAAIEIAIVNLFP